jgi:sugar phosphate isomerase/epimerase
MKIGFSVATSDVSTEKLPAQQGEFTANLDVLSELGYDGVEVSIRQPKNLDLDELQRDVEKRNLEVASIHTAAIGFQDKIWLCHPDKSIRDEALIRLKGALDAAAFFGVDVIIGSFRGQLLDGEGREKSLSWMHEAFKEGADYAVKVGSTVLFEPQTRFYINFGLTTQDGVEFAKSIDSPGMGLILDTFHMNIEDVSFSKSIFDAKEYLKYLQMSDSNRLYPGGGHVPWREVISSLKAIDFSGYLSLQCLMEPDFKTAAKLGINHLRSLL